MDFATIHCPWIRPSNAEFQQKTAFGCPVLTELLTGVELRVAGRLLALLGTHQGTPCGLEISTGASSTALGPRTKGKPKSRKLKVWGK